MIQPAVTTANANLVIKMNVGLETAYGPQTVILRLSFLMVTDRMMVVALLESRLLLTRLTTKMWPHAMELKEPVDQL